MDLSTDEPRNDFCGGGLSLNMSYSDFNDQGILGLGLNHSFSM